MVHELADAIGLLNVCIYKSLLLQDLVLNILEVSTQMKTNLHVVTFPQRESSWLLLGMLKRFCSYL